MLLDQVVGLADDDHILGGGGAVDQLEKTAFDHRRRRGLGAGRPVAGDGGGRGSGLAGRRHQGGEQKGR
ncbi:MAG TPA: hypothetical protein EYP73_01385 [Acidimicrobiia bacterium]|nr:hypothetical protein [Acidimicrobiia bacterium]